MSDFEVDPDEVLAIATGLREDSTSLDDVAGDLPTADGGVMTPVIENAVGGLLSYVMLVSQALSGVADGIEDSAIEYHESDSARREELARLMLPGATEAGVAEQVERTERADEIELAKLLMPGDPEAAEQAVLDSPSKWEEAQERQDDRNPFHDLYLTPEERS